MRQIIKTRSYKTADGNMFNDIYTAIDHQNDLAREKLSKLFNIYTEKCPEAHFKRIEISIIDFIVTNYKEIIDYLSGVTTKEDFTCD